MHRAVRARSAGVVASALVAATAGAAGIAVLAGPAAFGSEVSPLGTTTDVAQGSNPCLNGGTATTDPVNCNQYTAKTDVWISGLPNDVTTSADGTYFFAVLAPGGQPDPTDSLSPAGSLLSTDSLSQRTFTVTNGAVAMADATSTHAIDAAEGKIQMTPFLDTPNPGGVYVAAICEYDDAVLGDCSYDAFKVGAGTQTISPLGALTIRKSAAGTFTDTFDWALHKSLDPSQVVPIDDSTSPPTVGANSGSIPVTYDVSAAETDTVSALTVTGRVTVTNPNPVPVVATVTEGGLTDGTACTFDADGATTDTATMEPGDNAFAYTCTYPASTASVPSGVGNEASVDWGFQSSVSGDGSTVYVLDPPAARLPVSAAVAFTGSRVGTCITLSDDTYAALDGTRICAGDVDRTVSYTIDWTVPHAGCVDETNTASFITDDTAATGTSPATVRVCRTPLVTGARTIGFWKNKNGQRIIARQDRSGVCPSTSWLRSYAPFRDLGGSATCAGVARYVKDVLSAATARGRSMNPMLKAQVLATALDVYFTDPALGGNRLHAPSPLGGRVIDLTAPIDASPAFNGDPEDTVSTLLRIAASKSNAGGSVWYGQVKATQGLAKDTFDAINNQAAYGF